MTKLAVTAGRAMMTTRTMFTLLAILVLSDPAVGRADDHATARAIIDQAIEAMGRREALARYGKPLQIEYKGKVTSNSGSSDLTMKVIKVLPDKFATEQESIYGGRKHPFAIRFNGENGWNKSESASIGDKPPAMRIRDVDAVGVAAYRDLLYAEWLATLLPLDDAAFHLEPVEEITIGGRPAAGVKVARDGRPDVRLYFDKVNLTLAKLSRAQKGGSYEEVYDDYTDLDGLVYSRKTTRYYNGIKGLEMDVTDVKFLDSVDDEVFEKSGL